MNFEGIKIFLNLTTLAFCNIYQITRVSIINKVLLKNEIPFAKKKIYKIIFELLISKL